MMIKKQNDLLRNLINKVYNSTYLTNEVLDEIENDLEDITSLTQENKAYRELIVTIKAAKEYENLILRNNFRFIILSNLEKEYEELKRNYRFV